MLSNILIALGFMGTGILIGLGLAAWAFKGDTKKKEEKKEDDNVIYVKIYEVLDRKG
jgi:hypothetical protein